MALSFRLFPWSQPPWELFGWTVSFYTWGRRGMENEAFDTGQPISPCEVGPREVVSCFQVWNGWQAKFCSQVLSLLSSCSFPVLSLSCFILLFCPSPVSFFLSPWALTALLWSLCVGGGWIFLLAFVIFGKHFRTLCMDGPNRCADGLIKL